MRIKELDALRGLAAFAVFLFHFQLFDYGYLGVHLFFIISGFVIFLTAKSVKNPSDFVIARFSRLYPTYWVCLFLTFAVLYVGRGDVTFKQLAYNLTMFQAFLGEKNVDGAYWSLTEELVFYVIVFAALMLGMIHRVKLWAGGMLLLGLGGLFLNPESSGLQNNIEAVVKYFNLFVAGIIFYHIYLDQKIKLTHAAGLVLCLGIALMYGYGSYLPYFNHSIEIAVICSFFALFTLLVLGKLAFLQKYKWMLFMGEISYPFYLLHQEIGLTFRRLFATENLYVHIALVAVIFVGITLLATFINRNIEHSTSRAFKKKLQAWYNGKTLVPEQQAVPATVVATEEVESEPAIVDGLSVSQANKASAP
ncbi:acyltransferase family protein [Pontibacter cellulosilyticus]|uniref:Acyltransferase n=1 Tax=Pontibacter cellulosilyticus TaxID=1720253 RepID=A0A923N6R6_9BACT|nr:acyltransferase [Pontibacter cellulosilyticus]MBC5992772.1 acyltransferase [Pontibacter cellulosilyticus]